MTASAHTFHIPVMGTSFTIESPVKVARYGISSVISLVDDVLIEKMRRFYSKVMNIEYLPITGSDHDWRARRITAYLDLVDDMVRDQFEKLKSTAFEVGSEITHYFELLPEDSTLKQLYKATLATKDPAERQEAEDELRSRMKPGAIDVNIMTKVDRLPRDRDGNPLPGEFSDALASLRGYAGSKLSSSIVFSAGFNGRLYSYVEQFQDFLANEAGEIKKKIVIKVNDYRSAFTQGKFFAKKGIWVSEYRLESGLNCGGHAFGHGGSLMGPCLEEFKKKKDELVYGLFEIYNKALGQKKRKTFQDPHPVCITAQGGIGTAAENRFLLDYYRVDATGWGTPFLLVPEATTTDPVTLERLCSAGPEELYLSEVSPLGIPFNNLRTSLSEEHRDEKIRSQRFGSGCSKGFLISNTEFTESPICTASRLYQRRKIDEINGRTDMDEESRKAAVESVLAKVCLCNDLGGTATLVHELADPDDPPVAPAICPGPNLAWFSRPFSLKEMVDHIYGRCNLLNGVRRPHMFITELDMCIDYLEMEIRKSPPPINEQKIKYFREFRTSIEEGIAYYFDLVPEICRQSGEDPEQMKRDLGDSRVKFEAVISRHGGVFQQEPV